jgi:catechol 2,3-dioxygenase-like lactoylglutathione lyase family enzyme
MTHYVESRDQLVVEVYVRDIGESKRFYEALGFQLVRDASHFVELQWEDFVAFSCGGPHPA